VALTISNASTEGIFAHYDPAWLKVLEQHVLASKHPEYWLGLEVFLQAQRDAVTNMINNAIAVNAMDKLRYAQDRIAGGAVCSTSVARSTLSLERRRGDHRSEEWCDGW
jgi:hypothetical protein